MNHAILFKVLFAIGLISFSGLSIAQTEKPLFLSDSPQQACSLFPDAQAEPDAGLTPHFPLAAPHHLAAKDKQHFERLISLVQKKYRKIFQKHHLEMTWTVSWESGMKNAFASGDGNQRTTLLYGGLYRMADLSPDAFMHVICHELGHHLGGSPMLIFSPDLSAEGQADYYATQVCMPIVLAGLDNQAYLKKLNVPLKLKNRCDGIWKKNSERSAICQRSIMAALNFSKVLTILTPGETEEISWTTPAKEKAPETIQYGYPTPQCRFDTYLAGALCKPQEHLKNLPAGDTYNCSFHQFLQKKGSRPECWFKKDAIL